MSGRPRSGRLGPFRHTAFTIYWSGGLVSNIGSWLQSVAASVYVYQLTGSVLAVGALNFASYLPITLFSIVGGMVGDRFDRRSVVIVTHAVSGALAALLAIVSLTGGASVPVVIAISFLLNTIYAVAKPAMVAMLPAIVPRDELTDAVGINTLQFVIAQMAGPVLAAVIIGSVGVAWAFTANAISYLGPVIAMAALWRRGLAAGAANSRSAGAARGGAPISAVAYVREHRWVMLLLLGVVSISAPLEFVRTVSPGLAEAIGQPESAAGFVIATQGVGSVLALMVFVPLRRAGRSRDLATFGLLIQATGIGLTFLARDLLVAAIGGAFLGFGFSLCFPVLTSTLQAEVPDAVRGRIMAFHQMSHLGNRPFAAILVGSVAVVVGAQSAVLLALAVVPLGLLASSRAWRALADHHRAAAVAATGWVDVAALEPDGLPARPG